MLGDTGQPPPGVGPPQLTPPSLHPEQKTVTSAWALGGVSGGTNNMRTFSQILEEEKLNRNILEIHLTKTSWLNDQGKIEKPKNLTFDDIGEFIFDILKVSPSTCPP